MLSQEEQVDFVFSVASHKVRERRESLLVSHVLEAIKNWRCFYPAVQA